MKRLLNPAVALLLVGGILASCGGGSSTTVTTKPTKSTVNPKYGEFCVLATELDAKSNATHGEDPTAMSDPVKMKAAWATIMDSSEQLYKAAPTEVKDDIKKMLDGMVAMDKIYSTYNYNLSEMKAVSKVADQLNTIANDATVAKASQHFKTWMTANCGF